MAIDSKKFIRDLINDGFLKTQDDIKRLVLDSSYLAGSIYQKIYAKYDKKYDDAPSKSKVLTALKEAGIDTSKYVKDLTEITNYQFASITGNSDLLSSIDFTKITFIGDDAFEQSKFKAGSVVDLRNVKKVGSLAFYKAEGINKLIINSATNFFTDQTFYRLKSDGNFEVEIIGDKKLDVGGVAQEALFYFFSSDKVNKITLTCSYKFLLNNKGRGLFKDIKHEFDLNIKANGVPDRKIMEWVESPENPLKSTLGLTKNFVTQLQIID